MTSTLAPSPTVVSPPRATTRPRDRFHLVASWLMLLGVLYGFAPTFYLRSRSGAPPLPSWLVLHGIAQTAWFASLAVQSALIAARRVAWHRWLGWATIAVAVVILATSPAVVTRSVARSLAAGRTPIEVSFVVMVNALRIPFFAVMLAIAVWFRRQRDVHARALLLASISNFTPAVSRVAEHAGLSPLPFAVGLVAVAAIAMTWHDRRALGGVHRVTRYGLVALLLMLVIPIGLLVAGAAPVIVGALR